jgi:alginate O-acetyltransferase complex protein AlgI
MLFHTAIYAIFLPTVLGLYYLLGRIVGPSRQVLAQNFLLLIASYFFYGWWDYRFVGLIFISSLIDYVVGIALFTVEDQRRRHWILGASIAGNLGILGFFKYYNFFVESLIEAFAAAGVELHAPTLRVILPVGLSFYTFQSLTYTIAVYRRQISAERNAITFFAYVAFFPQLVAGPIERAAHFLPQFVAPRKISAAEFASGLRQILWGLFCKLVVADNCAVVANPIFDSPGWVPGSVSLVGAFFFAFQIYADFSGYSHIALGSARLFGFDLMQNFATPYFSRSIPEFWRRWHISLSTWFRDFVFIPLGGSRVSKPRYAANILITFTISGLWHGANWTFVTWGFLNGLYYLPHIVFGDAITQTPASNPAWKFVVVAGQLTVTFTLTLIAWIFFRAKTVTAALSMNASVLSPSVLTNPVPVLRHLGVVASIAIAGLAVALLVTLEFIQRNKGYALDVSDRGASIRWLAYSAIVATIACLRYTGSALDFIYFQF